MDAIKCGPTWFRKFCDEFPSIKRYKSSGMSIMRAKKACPEVRDAHYKGFQDFLDRLQMEGHLSVKQRSELWKYLCCYDETSFDPDGCSRKRYLSVSRNYKMRGPNKKKNKKKSTKRKARSTFRYVCIYHACLHDLANMCIHVWYVYSRDLPVHDGVCVLAHDPILLLLTADSKLILQQKRERTVRSM